MYLTFFNGFFKYSSRSRFSWFGFLGIRWWFFISTHLYTLILHLILLFKFGIMNGFFLIFESCHLYWLFHILLLIVAAFNIPLSSTLISETSCISGSLLNILIRLFLVWKSLSLAWQIMVVHLPHHNISKSFTLHTTFFLGPAVFIWI